MPLPVPTVWTRTYLRLRKLPGWILRARWKFFAFNPPTDRILLPSLARRTLEGEGLILLATPGLPNRRRCSTIVIGSGTKINSSWAIKTTAGHHPDRHLYNYAAEPKSWKG